MIRARNARHWVHERTESTIREHTVTTYHLKNSPYSFQAAQRSVRPSSMPSPLYLRSESERNILLIAVCDVEQDYDVPSGVSETTNQI
jgi:hypothetical protein